MIKGRTERALEDSLRRLHAGVTVEECLAVYPRQRKRLEPLLQAAAALYREPAASIADERRRVQYSRLMATIRLRPARTGGIWGWSRFVLVPVAAAAAAAAMIFGLNRLQAPDMAEAATTLTVLEGQVSVMSGQTGREVATGMTLLVGDSVSTSEGARAVVTFVDGSSMTLESDTQVTIRSISKHDDNVRVLVYQSRGRTWTYAPASRQSTIEVETPSTRLSAREAAFSTAVDDKGKTQVGAHSGGVEITSNGKRTPLSEGIVEVDREGQVTRPARAPTPELELIVRASGATAVLLSDPSGASVGYFSALSAVNQVPASAISRTGDDVSIRLPAPSKGAFRLVVGTDGKGAASVTISAGSDDDTVKLPASGSGYWSITFTVEGGALKVSRATEVAIEDLPAGVVPTPKPGNNDRNRGTPTPRRGTGTVTPSASPTRTPSSTPTPSHAPGFEPGYLN